MEITEEEYLENRLNHQIKWYSNKSMRSQRKYKVFKMLEILFAALIPVLSIFSKDLIQLTWVIASLGGGITIIEGWLSTNKYHENWIEYRSICEILKQEKYMFLTKTGVYNTQAKFKFLVERTESIISKENINWANLNVKSNRRNKNVR